MEPFLAKISASVARARQVFDSATNTTGKQNAIRQISACRVQIVRFSAKKASTIDVENVTAVSLLATQLQDLVVAMQHRISTDTDTQNEGSFQASDI